MDARKLRRSVERILFLGIVTYIAVAVCIKGWAYLRREIRRETANRRLAKYKEFSEVGAEKVRLSLVDYLGYAEAFVRSVSAGIARGGMGSIGKNERVVRMWLWSLEYAVSEYGRTVVVMETKGFKPPEIRAAITRLFGGDVSWVHEAEDWASWEEYAWVSRLAPAGFEETMLELSVRGKRRTMGVRDHVALVILQYIYDLYKL